MARREFEVVASARVRARDEVGAAREFFRVAGDGRLSTTVREVGEEMFDLQVNPWPSPDAGSHKVQTSFTFETRHAHEAHSEMLGALRAHTEWTLTVTDLATGEEMEVDGADLVSAPAPAFR